VDAIPARFAQLSALDYDPPITDAFRQIRNPQSIGLFQVGFAVFLFSTSPVLIRWAAPLTPVEITFWRMALAAAAVLGLAAFLRRGAWVGWSALPRFAGYGLVAAAHFFLYIASLQLTTVAHALALVYTAPVFVSLFSALLLGEGLRRRVYFGLAVAVLGVAVLTGFEPRFDPRMALGDLLAVGSAIAFGIYSVAGRHERARYPLLTYAGTVYAFASLWLLPLAALSYTPSYTPRATGALLLLGLLPLALGHTLYNAALRRLHAAVVNVVATQEVTGGVLLGAVLLAEFPSAAAIAGGALTLLGVSLVILWGRPGERVTG
jgi:drug/metabolite transporter (DMT)-like permease